MHSLWMVAMAPGGSSGQQSPVFMFGWLAIMLAIFYFMLIRPQQRKEKQRRAMLDQIKSGDRIVFAAGLLGIVVNVKDKLMTVKIADNVKIDILRSSVTQVLPKGEQAEEA